MLIEVGEALVEREEQGSTVWSSILFMVMDPRSGIIKDNLFIAEKINQNFVAD